MALILAFVALGAQPTSAQRRTIFKEPLPAPLLPAEQVWMVMLGDVPSAGGALDGRRVYVPLKNGNLIALDRETGKSIWSHPIPTAWPPLLQGDTLYVVSNGEIHALDTATAAERWRTALDGTPVAPLSWDDGIVIAVLEHGIVAAFDTAAGQQLWRQDIGDDSKYRAVGGGGADAVYVARVDGRLVALDRRNGGRVWDRLLSGTLTEPAVARERVFVGSTDNFLYAMNAKSGALQWKWRSGGDVIGATADQDGNVFFASLDNVLRAVRRGSGNQRWKEETPSRPALPPWTFGRIVVLSGVSDITVFAAKDGRKIGSYSAPAELEGPPLLDPELKPYRVSFVAITRDGRAVGMRASEMMFREPMLSPLQPLPGRRLERERMAEPIPTN